MEENIRKGPQTHNFHIPRLFFLSDAAGSVDRDARSISVHLFKFSAQFLFSIDKTTLRCKNVTFIASYRCQDKSIHTSNNKTILVKGNPSSFCQKPCLRK